jgi:predicted nucleic acid-binding protein
MQVEVAQTLRRMVMFEGLPTGIGTAAHLDLLDLVVSLVPYRGLAFRAWELRDNVSTADACYVALAEGLDAELATLDRRLTRAPGPRCRFLTPPPV